MKEKSTIPSPCISVCTMDEDSGFCRGCMRTLDEIAQWDHYDDSDKKEVLLKLEKRRAESGNTSLHC